MGIEKVRNIAKILSNDKALDILDLMYSNADTLTLRDIHEHLKLNGKGFTHDSHLLRLLKQMHEAKLINRYKVLYHEGEYDKNIKYRYTYNPDIISIIQMLDKL